MNIFTGVTTEFPLSEYLRPDFRAVLDNSIDVKPKRKKNTQLVSVAESVIYDVFLIMILRHRAAVPFYGSSLLGGNLEHNPSLSNWPLKQRLIFFERGMASDRLLGPTERHQLYDIVRQGTSKFPNNPMERALFALLHISKQNYHRSK